MSLTEDKRQRNVAAGVGGKRRKVYCKRKCVYPHFGMWAETNSGAVGAGAACSTFIEAYCLWERMTAAVP